MRRAVAIVVLAVAPAGCGSSAIQGVLAWSGTPTVKGRSLQGVLRNTTSHSEPLSASTMRLLDDRGRRVRARIRVGAARLPAHGTTALRASWKAGKPVRLDYGGGTLALPSR